MSTPREPFVVGVVPEGTVPQWAVTVDGKDPLVYGQVVIENERFGRLTVGQDPRGWGGWFFEQAGGGGAVSAMFAVIGADPVMGLVPENRPNMGGEVLCIAGGFKNAGESAVNAEARERLQEAGLPGEAVQIEALGINCNRAFWITTPATGDRVSALELPAAVLSAADDSDADVSSWRISDDCLPGDDSDAKKAGAVRFFRLCDLASVTQDALALSGAMHLLSYLASTGRLTLATTAPAKG